MWTHETTSARLAALAVFLLTPLAADAQSPGPVEIWGTFSGVLDAPGGSLTSSYQPSMLYAAPTDASGTAGQMLTLSGARAGGFQAGINIFPADHVGFQLLVDRADVPLEGANGPYDVALTYISRQPPDYTPRTFTAVTSTPWPDTAGSLKQLAVAANLVARTAAAGRVRATVSGGLSYYRLSGDAQALGFTEFRMGGHGVLFSDENHMNVAFDATNAFGFDVGGDLDVEITRHLSAMVGYRFFGASDVSVPARPTAILNADQVATSETVDQIAQRMQLGPAHVRLSSSRVVVGLKVMP